MTLDVVVIATLVLTAAVHTLPVVGVLGGRRLHELYGIRVDDPVTRLLLQHRAVLFAIVAGIAVVGAAWQPLRLTALVVAAVSVWSFVVLWRRCEQRSAPIDRVARIDIVVGVLVLASLAVTFVSSAR